MSRVIGQNAELRACEYLQQNGLKLMQQNYYSRFGEIDIIMQDKNDSNAIVFVEVKERKSGISHAIESITPSKQRKIVKAAQFFLLKLGYDVNCRFDAVALDGNGNIEWLKNIITL